LPSPPISRPLRPGEPQDAGGRNVTPRRRPAPGRQAHAHRLAQVPALLRV